jgi:hypothetical protein
MIPPHSHHIPKNWKKNDPNSIKKWMGSLPTVRDIKASEIADVRYRELLILNDIKR